MVYTHSNVVKIMISPGGTKHQSRRRQRATSCNASIENSPLYCPNIGNRMYNVAIDTTRSVVAIKTTIRTTSVASSYFFRIGSTLISRNALSVFIVVMISIVVGGREPHSTKTKQKRPQPQQHQEHVFQEQIIRESTHQNLSHSIQYPDSDDTINDDDNIAFSERIIGGDVVEDTDLYPFYAFPAGSKLCGGTLIYDDILLTAAHCNGTFLEMGALVGGTFLDSSQSQFISVLSEYVHPNYIPGPEQNDIMLVQLSETSRYPFVQLNYNDTNMPTLNQTVTVIGFGYTSTTGPFSERLLQANVSIVSFDQCQDYYGDQMIDNETLILCAGTESGQQDTCFGDSGGPMLMVASSDNDNNTILQQVGIVSYGHKCGQPNTPSVYTRVSAYADWIQQGICTLSSNPPLSCDNATTTPTNTTTSPTSPTSFPSSLSTPIPTSTVTSRLLPTASPANSTMPTSVPRTIRPATSVPASTNRPTLTTTSSLPTRDWKETNLPTVKTPTVMTPSFLSSPTTNIPTITMPSTYISTSPMSIFSPMLVPTILNDTKSNTPSDSFIETSSLPTIVVPSEPTKQTVVPSEPSVLPTSSSYKEKGKGGRKFKMKRNKSKKWYEQDNTKKTKVIKVSTNGSSKGSSSGDNSVKDTLSPSFSSSSARSSISPSFSPSSARSSMPSLLPSSLAPSLAPFVVSRKRKSYDDKHDDSGKGSSKIMKSIKHKRQRQWIFKDMTESNAPRPSRHTPPLSSSADTNGNSYKNYRTKVFNDDDDDNSTNKTSTVTNNIFLRRKRYTTTKRRNNLL